MLLTDSTTIPKVSIIIPVSNAETYLRQCIGSLLAQTLEDIEIICVNNGSTDKSLTIIEEYVKKDIRIKLVNQDKQTLATTRNKGRYLARGEFITFLDCEDSVKPDTYQKLYNSAKEYNSDIVLCAVTTLDTKTMQFSDVEKYYTLELFNESYNDRAIQPSETYEFMFGLCQVPWNKLYKREFLEKKHIAFRDKIDYEERLFFLESYLSAQSISLVKEPLIVHRLKTDNNDSKKLGIFKTLKFEKDYLYRNKLYKKLKYQFQKHQRNTLVYYFNTIQNTLVKIRYRFKFFMLYPFQKVEKFDTKE